MIEFCEDYRLNHIAYLKNPKKKDIVKNSDNVIDNKPGDEKYVVTHDMMKKLSNRKIYFTFLDLMIR